MNRHIATAEYEWALPRADGRRYAVLAGRLLFSSIFLISAPGLFTGKLVGYAAQAGVQMPGILVPAAGVVALAGGLSVALGYQARIGALLLALFLVPVTLTMHAFWAEKDPMMAQIQQVNFLKNIALLGAALLIGQYGAGPLSLDAWRARRAEPGLRFQQRERSRAA